MAITKPTPYQWSFHPTCTNTSRLCARISALALSSEFPDNAIKPLGKTAYHTHVLIRTAAKTYPHLSPDTDKPLAWTRSLAVAVLS